MNLDEVKKHVKFDMFLTTLIYIMIAVCLFLALIFTLAIPAKADSMKVYCSSGDYSSCVALYQGSNSITANSNVVNNFNTSSSYRYFTITSMSLQKNVKYLFKIIYKPTTKELKNVYFKEYSTDIDGNTSSADGYLNFSIDTAWGTGGYQSTATFTYQPSDSYRRNTSNFINLDFGSSGVTITGIDITEVDSQTAISLDELKDQQQDLLSTKCSNILNLEDVYALNDATVTNVSPSSIEVSSSSTWSSAVFTMTTEIGKVYYVKGRAQSIDSSSTGLVWISSQNSDFNNRLFIYEDNGTFNSSFIATSTTTYVRLYGTKTNSNSGSIYYDLMVSPENDPFCAYGSVIPKLNWIGTGLTALTTTQNEIKDLQQEQNNYLMDDSDPTVDNQAISDTLGMVQTNNPLSYLLTLPTNLLTAIINGLSSNTCQDFEIGKFGSVGRHDLGTYTFKFPCINVEQKLGSSLYNVIDIFVSIGFLVITIVKFYNTISNYLTLGAEDEVKAHSHFLTPMDFLGNILGGNISGVGDSLSSMNGGF